ncbi:MAG: ABC transporter permease subunit [Gammaproteobacteria bacterium]|nr:ABC transporter permease subunit [Gammaproteobacteria bacterium]
MMLTLALRELRSLFFSPLAWCILAIVQLILGYLFLAQIDVYLQLQPQLAAMDGAPGVTQIVVTPIYGNATIILLLVIPLLTMRLLAEEQRSQTLPLLFSAPLSMTEIVLGKYLGILLFLVIMMLMILLMPLSLLMGTSLDLGVVFSGFLGLALLLASFAAAGLFMSSLTAQPSVAAISTFGLLLLLWIIDWAGNTNTDSVLHYLSMLKHYEPLLNGQFKSSDVIYYLLLIVTFLVMSIRRLDSYRLQH